MLVWVLFLFSFFFNFYLPLNRFPVSIFMDNTVPHLQLCHYEVVCFCGGMFKSKGGDVTLTSNY